MNYTPIQALRAYTKIMKPLWIRHEEGSQADAGFDGGEFSGPWHDNRISQIEQAAIDYVADRMGVTVEDIEIAMYDGRNQEFTAMFGPMPMTCKNSEIHAKFAERGIEDQCPYCLITGL